MSIRAHERIAASLERRRTRERRLVVALPAARVRAAPSLMADEVAIKHQGDLVVAAAQQGDWVTLTETFFGLNGYMLLEQHDPEEGLVTILREIGIGAVEASYASSHLPQDFVASVLGNLDHKTLEGVKPVCRLWASEARILLNDICWQAEHLTVSSQLRLYCASEDWPADAALILRLERQPDEAFEHDELGLPLHFAIRSLRSCEVVSALLAAYPLGATTPLPHAQGTSGDLPLHLAARLPCVEYNTLSAVLHAYQQAILKGLSMSWAYGSTRRTPASLCACMLTNGTLQHFRLLLAVTAAALGDPEHPQTTIPIDYFEREIGPYIRGSECTVGGMEELRAICAEFCPAYDTSSSDWAKPNRNNGPLVVFQSTLPSDDDSSDDDDEAEAEAAVAGA